MATPDAQDPKLGSDTPKPIADKVQAAGTDAVKEGTHTVDAVILAAADPLAYSDLCVRSSVITMPYHYMLVSILC